VKDLPSISIQLLRNGLASTSPEIAETQKGQLSSNVQFVEFEDDPTNPVFSARLHYSGTGPRVGLAVDVVWTNGQEQRFRYHLPNAWGWAARTILKRAPNGVAVAASDMGSPTGGSQLQYMTVYTSDVNYGVWNGTQSNVFINYTWSGGVHGYYLPARHRALLAPAPITVVYAELEPD
jgi:hypothetical protein